MTSPFNPDDMFPELAGQSGKDLWNSYTSENPVIRSAEFGLDDVGNGRRLVHYFGDRIRLVTNMGGTNPSWRVWTGIVWQDAHDGEMLDLAIQVADKIIEEAEHVPESLASKHKRWAERSHSIGSLMAMIKAASAEPKLWTVTQEYDRSPYLLNTPQGVLDLSPGVQRLQPHDRLDMITKLCPTPYDPDATSPLVDSFLDRFLPDPEERWYLLATLACACLIGGNPQRAMLMLLGPTTTGKTTLVQLITETMGADYVSTVQPSVFRGNLEDKPRPDILKALGARLVVANEGSDSWELHADQVKRITGEDVIVARGMNSNVMVERRATFTPIITSNATPKIKSADEAIRRRLRVMIMDRQVSVEEDSGAQRSALLNDFEARKAMLSTLIRHLIECNATMPAAPPVRFEMSTDEVFAELDDVNSVLSDLIGDKILSYDYRCAARHCITINDLYQIYYRRAVRSSSPREVMSSKQFSMRLRALGFDVRRSDGMRLIGFRQGEIPLSEYM